MWHMCCPPLSKFIVDMIATFGFVTTKTLDIIWSVAPQSRIHELELAKLMDTADTGNKPAIWM